MINFNKNKMSSFPAHITPEWYKEQSSKRSLASHLGEIKHDIDKISDRLEKRDHCIDDVLHQFDDIQKSLDNVFDNINNTSDHLDNVLDNISGLRKDITDMFASLPSIVKKSQPIKENDEMK